MSTLTIGQVETSHDLDLLDHLDREATVPVIDRIEPQGDVLVVRRDGRADASTPIPASGVVVVRGETGNAHALFGRGFYDARTPSPTDLVVGVVTVPEGGEVLLSHPEHGPLMVAPGTYECRRQRQQSEEIALVAD